MAAALGPVTPELVLVDPELAALVRGGGPRTDCLAFGTREPANPKPRRAATDLVRSRLFTALLVVSLVVNAALIGHASTSRAHSAAAMLPAPALNAASPAHGIALPVSSHGAHCSDPGLRGPTTSAAIRPAQLSATAASSSTAQSTQRTAYPCRSG
jgi:hypothetical protein